MAPNFNKNAIAANQSQQRACTIFDIYDLACSDKEVQEISEMMGGDYFIGQDADKATFEEIAKDYRILHLATHSCPDEEDPNFSKIFLADEAITNYDLFNYEFNADLAVLSACNTGFGKLVKGEGVMPLSKGFIQAGIPSTVMSLWPVDDCGTSRMMKLLYQYLDEGLPKDEALQRAKLDFIQNSNAIYQHPYYWSAFIHMGNFEPIHEKSSIPPVVWWIAGGLAILGLFSVSRKRKKQAA
jgi:CHAT domain-containing protein